jgi:hypothetical protein
VGGSLNTGKHLMFGSVMMVLSVASSVVVKVCYCSTVFSRCCTARDGALLER